MGRPTRLVTLTSDLGFAYAAQMKAVLYRSLPPGFVIDLSHDLPAHAVTEAAFLFRQMASGFPAGSVHVAIIDPGVGGRRTPLVIRCGDGSHLIGPDNGVLSPLAEKLGSPEAFALDPDRVAEGPVSATFEGRDLFAPAAARVATGTLARRLGRPVPFLRLRLPPPRRGRSVAHGEVVHVDRFGNLITNVPTDWVPLAVTDVAVHVGGRDRGRWPRCRIYEALAPRAFGVIGSSFGTLELSAREARAADRLHAGVGTGVSLHWRPRSSLPRRKERK